MNDGSVSDSLTDELGNGEVNRSEISHTTQGVEDFLAACEFPTHWQAQEKKGHSLPQAEWLTTLTKLCAGDSGKRDLSVSSLDLTGPVMTLAHSCQCDKDPGAFLSPKTSASYQLVCLVWHQGQEEETVLPPEINTSI